MALKTLDIIDIGRPDNECKIKIGKGVGSQHLFLKNEYGEFFNDIDDFFFFKQDLLKYLFDAKEEFLHPSENYHFVRVTNKSDRDLGITTPTVITPIDMASYWNDLMEEVLNIEDLSYLGFVKGMGNDDAGRFYYHNDSPDSPYNLLYKMCIPTKQAGSLDKYRSIYKLVKIQDTVTNKKYIHIIPIFNMAYSEEQLSDFLKRDYPTEEDNQRSYIFNFFFKYSDLINQNGYSINEIIIKAGIDIDYIEDLKIAVDTFYNNISDTKNVYRLSANAERVYDNGNNQKSPIVTTLQQIFYGAPGTGKSYATNVVTAKYPGTIRTTFHPDSDYSTFVGCYKPTTTNAMRYGLNGADTVALKYPDGAQKGEPIMDVKIVYKFVKQAFLKAYIKAWELFTQNQTISTTSTSGIVLTSFVYSNEQFLLHSMDNESVNYIKKSTVPVDEFKDLVRNCWSSLLNSDTPDDYEVGTTERYQATACFWYKKQIQNYFESSDEECWDHVIKELQKEGGKIEGAPGGNQVYSISLEGGSVVITSNMTFKNRAKRKTINDWFSSTSEKESGSVQYAIAQKLKEYSADFDEAWNLLKDEIEDTVAQESGSFTPNNVSPQFLVIEEINRGNCAQIFGDLFQLLDRKNGFSEYPIEADEDIRKALLEDKPEDGLSFGKKGLMFSDQQIAFINQQYDKPNHPSQNIAEKIKRGQVLVLPPNLYIWATMNTSDQSLFPIDSAFKRRWDWKYIKIAKGKDEDGNELVWKIKTGVEHDWWEFVQQINRIIYSMTSSADKQLGFYFCQATNNEITAETFVNKVAFYLWNDVFKDFAEEESDLFKFKKNENDKEDSDLTFPDFFNDEGQVIEAVAQRFIENVMKWSTDEKKEKKDKEED